MTSDSVLPSSVAIRRVYEPGEPSDGLRVLVDRLWPRGMRKEALEHDQWITELAPSTELRRFYGHDPGRFAEFRTRYRAELAAQPARRALRRLRADSDGGALTLLTATKDVSISHAAVLAELLRVAD
ncbi:MAG: DUF488 domain-containing protein [Sciscionella sp.]